MSIAAWSTARLEGHRAQGPATRSSSTRLACEIRHGRAGVLRRTGEEGDEVAIAIANGRPARNKSNMSRPFPGPRTQRCALQAATAGGLHARTDRPPRRPPFTSACHARGCRLISKHVVLQWQVQQQGTIGGYHFFSAPHSNRAWFALAFAAQIPFLEPATYRAILSQHALQHCSPFC